MPVCEIMLPADQLRESLHCELAGLFDIICCFFPTTSATLVQAPINILNILSGFPPNGWNDLKMSIRSVTALVKTTQPLLWLLAPSLQSSRGWGALRDLVAAVSPALCSCHPVLSAPGTHPACSCLRTFACTILSAGTMLPSSRILCSGSIAQVARGFSDQLSDSLSYPVRFPSAPLSSSEVIWFWGSFSGSASDALYKNSSPGERAVSTLFTALFLNVAWMNVYKVWMSVSVRPRLRCSTGCNLG